MIFLSNGCTGYRDDQSDNDRGFKKGEVIVKFKQGTAGRTKINARNSVGVTTLNEFPSLRIQHLKLSQNMSVEEAVKLYQADPNVEYAEPNYLVTTQRISNDPLFNQLWGLYNTGQTGGTSGADISAPDAWDYITGDSSIVVAVVDTGVDYTHEDLAGNMWTNLAEIPDNGIDDDGNGYVDDVYGIDVFNNDSDPMDDSGHGTHVAGIIGAVGNNGVGVTGVNWDVKIMSCKFLAGSGSGFVSDALKCLEYVKKAKDAGVNVAAVNNSWGGERYSQALYDAIYNFRDVLFITAAGNNSGNNDRSPLYPAGYYLPNIISVAASDNGDSKASFSNYGNRTVHISAPGADILSTTPNNTYTLLSGTSMAAPYVAGLAALLKFQAPNRGWIELKNLILSGGDSLTSLNGATITGKRINAYGSLTCADNYAFSILKYPPVFELRERATLSALSINCESSAGPVNVETSEGESVTLYDDDDGYVGDLHAGDGIFTGEWTPSGVHISSLSFSSPAGTEILPLTLDIYFDSEKTYDTDGSYSWHDIAVDDSGNMYVAALAGGSGSYDYNIEIIRYDSSGVQIGLVTFGVVNSAYVQALSLVLSDSSASDPSPNVYMTGYSEDSGNFDYMTVKYDLEGAEGDSLSYDSSGLDYAGGAAVDLLGNLYLTGYSGDPGSYDYVTVKYDSSGTMIWEKTYDSGGSDYAGGVAVDEKGYVYVTGTADSGTAVDYVTIKYDPDGNLIHMITYNSIQGSEAYGITVDSSSNIYVAGTPHNGNDEDSLIIKYKQRLKPQNRLPVAHAKQSTGTGGAVTFDGAGSYDPDGNITAFRWGFGDGETGSDSTAVHVYSAPGQYTVILTVIDDDGEQDTDTMQITISPSPSASGLVNSGEGDGFDSGGWCFINSSLQ